MATLTADSYYQEIERALQKSEKSLDLHVHSFIQNFYKDVQYNDRDILLKFIPNECDTIIQLNSPFWNRQIQFILEAFLVCVFMYQWTVEEFMTKSVIFSSIPKTSRPWQLVFNYLREFIKYIAEPIVPEYNNELIEEKSDYDDEDDDDDEEDDFICDETSLPHELQPLDCNKHSLDRLLYYTFQVHEGMNRRRNHRQIDMMFIPKQLNQINDAYFADKGIKCMKLSNYQNIHDLLNDFHDCETREKSAFSRGVMLIIGDDNNCMDDDTVYLFELNSEPVPEGLLQYTEMPMIWNTTHNPTWLDDMMKTNNGVIISYHHHNNIDLQQQKHVSTRLYVWYKSLSGRCYGTRVLKDHMINILKVFCDDSDDYLQYWDDEAQFNDREYSDFIDLYLKELGIPYESNIDGNILVQRKNSTDDESMSFRSATPFSWQSDWSNGNEHNDEKMDVGLLSNPPGPVAMIQSDWSSDGACGVTDEQSIPSPSGTSVSQIEVEVEVEVDSESISLRSATPCSLQSDWSTENGSENGSENEMSQLFDEDENNQLQANNDMEMPNPFSIDSILLHGSNHLMSRNSFVAFGKHETLFSNAGYRENRIQRETQLQLLVGYVTMMDINKYIMAYMMLIHILKRKQL